MFEKVLFPTDFSSYATRISDFLDSIPGMETLIILHALKAARATTLPWLPRWEELSSPEEAARRRLEELEHRLSGIQARVEGRIALVEHGRVAQAILRQAEEERVSLIVMGARGRGIISDLLLGSVSERVLRQSRAPVLIMRFRSDGKGNLEPFRSQLFSRVLCPVDFSRPSRETLAMLGKIPQISELILLHVIQSAEDREELERRIEEAEEGLRRLRDMLLQGRKGLRVRILFEFGMAAEKICERAVEEDVSLVVLSRFGKRDYIRKIPIGSTAAEVAVRAERPVLVCNPALTLEVEVRELAPDEFEIAEEIWIHYRGQEADRERDRIFAVFLEGTPVCVARARRHPDGLEVDGVFTLEEFRGRSYARIVMDALIDACGIEPLFLHSTLELIPFYRSLGFVEIVEEKLPLTIRERFGFAKGDLEGANVSPMVRVPAEPGERSGL
ncbi:MAG: GNAT family N-acetyltransferase [Methanomicrobiaceae archaeon]|nr:GNAT family N-acetyltransferase [Methanomicrobiaceae archaeon]